MGTSLVLELQRDALDDTVPVSSLLRKAIAVASKLSITDASQWLTAELKGYPRDMEVPEYRMVFGERKAKHPYGGLMPVFGPGTKPQRVHVPVRESLSSIEDLTKEEGGEAVIPMAPIKNDGIPYETILVLNRTGLHAVKDRVRSAVLEWALDLERKGIIGEGLTFNLQEKEAAKTVEHHRVHRHGDRGRGRAERRGGWSQCISGRRPL